MHKLVFTLLLTGVLLCVTGHQYQKKQKNSQITWQDVHIALNDVEVAKGELVSALTKSEQVRTQP